MNFCIVATAKAGLNVSEIRFAVPNSVLHRIISSATGYDLKNLVATP